MLIFIDSILLGEMGVLLVPVYDDNLYFRLFFLFTLLSPFMNTLVSSSSSDDEAAVCDDADGSDPAKSPGELEFCFRLFLFKSSIVRLLMSY